MSSSSAASFGANVKFIDLFAGIGGFHEALASRGATCVFASEWDSPAASTYARNHQTTPVGDITKVDEASIPAHNFLCAGFPCQAFSISGKRLGFDDARGTLFFDVARILKAQRPAFALLENVRNFAVHDGGRTLAVVVTTLSELGYTVSYKVLNSAHYGSAQKRERIYILATRADLGLPAFQWPERLPAPAGPFVKDILLPSDHPDLATMWLTRPDIQLDAEAIAEANKAVAEQPLRVGIVNRGGQGERIYHPNGKAITLSAYGGGAGAKTGLYFIDGKVRKLHPRECARLLGLPESFEINKNKNQAYKQFGNSVVVPVLQAIVDAMDKQGYFGKLPPESAS